MLPALPNKSVLSGHVDFGKICRICQAEKENLLNLFAVDDLDEPSLGEKLLSCTSLDLYATDGLPQHICYACAKALEYVHSFRKRCHQSDAELRKLLSQFSQSVEIKQEEVYEELEDTSQYEIVEIEADQSEEVSDSQSYIEEKPVKKKLDSTHVLMAGDEVICKDEKTYKCENCDASYFTASALRLHQKIEQNRLRQSKKLRRPQKESKGREESAENKFTFFCKACNVSFESKEDYDLHNTQDHNSSLIACTICGKLCKKSTIKNHIQMHYKEKNFECQICSKTFADEKYLKRHMLYHQTTVFKCMEEDCDKEFTVKHKLVQHLRRYHSKEISKADIKNIVGFAPEECNEDIEILEVDQ